MADLNKGSALVFSDVASIVIKVIVGLASFQLLAPYIWNYLSELVHFRKIWTFRIISGVYFILPLLIIALWWKDARHKFKGLANPAITDENPVGLKDKIQKPLNLFVNLSGFIIVFLLIVYFLILFFPFESCIIFYLIQVVSLAGIVVLVVCFNRITKLNFEFFDDYSEDIKLAVNKFRRLRIIFYIFFVIVLILEFCYLTKTDYLKRDSKCVCENNSIKNRFKLENPFNTIEFKASIAASRKKLEEESTKLLLKDKLLKLHRYKYADDTSKYTYDYSGLFEKKYNPNVSDFPRDPDSDTLLGRHYRLARNRIIAFSNFADSMYLQLEAPTSDVCLNCPPYELDTLIAINKLDQYISDSSLIKTKIAWFDAAKDIFQTLELKADKSARRQLTTVIGNIQMKGIFLFFNILTFLVCLYVFLKTNRGILTLFSGSPSIAKNAAIKKQTEEGLADNQNMLDSVWIYMTIIFGLLIPLLKPVSEDKINLDRPFQMLTIPGQIQGESKTTTDDHSLHFTSDSSKTYYYNFNISNNGKITPDSGVGLDEETKKLIKEINEKVKKLNTKTEDRIIKEDIINKIKYFNSK